MNILLVSAQFVQHPKMITQIQRTHSSLLINLMCQLLNRPPMKWGIEGANNTGDSKGDFIECCQVSNIIISVLLE
jgi:hypothetical protein